MRRRLLTVLLAGALAVLGVVAVLAYVHNADARAIKGYETVKVFVASNDIPAGTKVEAAVADGQLVQRKYPLNAVPSDALRSIDHADSKLVTGAALPRGALLLQSLLVAKSQAASSLVIPPSKMAVSIQVCLSGDVAGYVQPGAKVAIYDTGGSDPTAPLQYSCSSHQPPNKGKVVTRVVLPNVEVLSVIPNPLASQSGSTSSTPASGTAASASTSVASQGMVLVTLVVDAYQAPKLINASISGALTLALLTPSTNVNVTGSTSAP